MENSLKSLKYLGLVADPVIEAIARLEFEDGLRMGVLPEAADALRAAASILESIPNPSGGAGLSWVGCGCHKVQNSDQIPILSSSAHGWCQP